MNKSKKTILLVEDDIPTATLEKKILERNGYTVVVAEDGEKAIELVKKNRNINLILMDIDLKADFDGTQVAQTILKDHDLPLIFLSSHTHPIIVKKTEGITSYGYIVKNSGERVLIASIKMALSLHEEKKKTQEKEIFIRTILENLPIGVAVNTLEPEVNFSYINDKFCEFYRVKKDDLLIRDNFWEAVYEDPKFRDKIKKRVLSDTSSGDPKKMHWEDIPITRKDHGRTTYISARNIPIPDSEMIISTVWDTTVRKMYENELRESELRYKVLHNASFGGIGIHDKGVILECNQGLSEMTGYSYSELIGMNGLLLIAEEYRDMVMEKILTGYEKPYEAIAVRKNGEKYPIRLEARKIPFKGKSVRVTEFRDITERKEIEKMLWENKKKMDLVLDNIHEVVWTYEMNPEGKFVSSFISPVGSKMLGISEEELNHSFDVWFSHVISEDLIKVKETMFDAIKTGKGKPIDYRIKTSNGTVKWIRSIGNLVIEPNGNLILIGTGQDITNRKKAEVELQKSEEKLREIFNSTNEAIFIHDAETGKILDCNDQTLAMYRYDNKQEVLQKNVGDLSANTEEYNDEVAQKKIKQSLKEGKMSGEWLAKRKNGEIFWVEVTLKNTTILGRNSVIAVVRDITNRKKEQDKIVSLLKEKELLLKEIHHRVKNNIVNIEVLIRMQIEETTNSEVLAALNDVLTRVTSIRILYENLLIGDSYKEMDVKLYLESLIDSIVSIFPNSKNIEVNKELVDFKLNTKKIVSLGIIVNELLTNAYKHAFKNETGGKISISLEVKSKKITLTVKDNGIGINKNYKDTENFGFGLGLVRMLAETLKGSFKVENDNGTKNTIFFDL